MIRRQAGTECFLITQQDHAQISSQLAAHLGNAQFSCPDPRQSVVLAAALHDAGWPLHDDEPTLDSEGLPLDVFQTPRSIGLKLWTASADRAAACADPYAGLLVSLHSMHLAYLGPAPADRQQQFQLNKFHHREVERQEHLRVRLGLATDTPLTLGLAQPNISAAEDQLRFNFQELELVDLLSLWLCCRPAPATAAAELGARRVKICADSDAAVRVAPWPFDAQRIAVQIPFRRLPLRRFTDEAEFRRLFHAAPLEILQSAVAQT